MKADTLPPAVELEHHRSPTFGERWSLVFEGVARITRGSEIEARRAAREHGWVVVRLARIEEGA